MSIQTKMLQNPNEKLILALDGMSKEDVFSLLKKLPETIWVKVGLELFVSEGPEILIELREQKKRIFF